MRENIQNKNWRMNKKRNLHHFNQLDILEYSIKQNI